MLDDADFGYDPVTKTFTDEVKLIKLLDSLDSFKN